MRPSGGSCLSVQSDCRVYSGLFLWTPAQRLGRLSCALRMTGHVIKSVSFLCVSASRHHRPRGVESPQPSLKFHVGLFLFGHLIKSVSFLLSVNAFHHHCPMGMQGPPPSCKFHIRVCLFGHLIKPVLFLFCVNVSRHHCPMGVQAPPPSLKFHLRLSLFGPLIKPVRQELGVSIFSLSSFCLLFLIKKYILFFHFSWSGHPSIVFLSSFLIKKKTKYPFFHFSSSGPQSIFSLSFYRVFVFFFNYKKKQNILSFIFHRLVLSLSSVYRVFCLLVLIKKQNILFFHFSWSGHQSIFSLSLSCFCLLLIKKKQISFSFIFLGLVISLSSVYRVFCFLFLIKKANILFFHFSSSGHRSIFCLS
ncbi:unnamed protein product [Acanthosepion pharaonis]|uniref:Uncharacterized protein n=1 Tax=Acanthosepion pharaonis TaxID=158019 RepID=A0A812DI56_ACAPH|nr:unnamed protein product [Sepia pharaonis]